MYKQIDANRHKSWLLLALFVGVLGAVGYAYGFVTNDTSGGLAFALILSLGMTLVSWFSGDKIILWQTGAQEIKTRDENSAIWNLVENLCITAGIQRPRIYLVDDPSPNAFATGRDPKHASLALTTGLLRLLDKQELEGVISHELSHIKNFDTRFMMLVAVLVGAISLLGHFIFRGGLGHRSNDRENGGGALMALGIIFILLSPVIGELIKLAISRRREYLADASGALLTRYPEGLARALEKISSQATPLKQTSQATAHLWISDPYGRSGSRQRLMNLFSTHPPIEERIRQLRAMEKAK